MKIVQKAALTVLVISALLLGTISPVFAVVSAETFYDRLSPDTDGRAATPPNATEDELREELPPGEEPPVQEELPAVWKEAATFDELEQAALEYDHIRLTADITIPVGEFFGNSGGVDIYLELDANTLYVEGFLRLQAGARLQGLGGEEGLVHVRQGGEAHIHGAVLLTEEGYALWQEEGSILTHTPVEGSSGDIHYAQRAVARPDSDISPRLAMPVAIVRTGQLPHEVLPETDSVRFYQDGEETLYYPLEVQWDLEAFDLQVNMRERVLITGSYPDAEAFVTPICLVVFLDERPAVFLDCWGSEDYGRPSAKVKVELVKPELGCRFEWSQDGENWQPANAVEKPSWDGRLAFNLSFLQDEPPAYPYYLSALVDYPDGSVGYSDTIIIYEAETQGGSGGNRGGGTDLDPPKLPPVADGDDGEVNDKDDSNDSDNTPIKPPGLPEAPEIPEGEMPEPPKPPDTSGSSDLIKPPNPPKPSVPLKPGNQGMPKVPLITETPDATDEVLPTEGIPAAVPAINSLAQVNRGTAQPPVKADAESPASNLPLETMSDEVSPSSTMANEENQTALQLNPGKSADINSPEHPDPSVKATAQTTAGVVLTVGIMVLVLIGSSTTGWGKCVLSLLRRLISK